MNHYTIKSIGGDGGSLFDMSTVQSIGLHAGKYVTRSSSMVPLMAEVVVTTTELSFWKMTSTLTELTTEPENTSIILNSQPTKTAVFQEVEEVVTKIQLTES
jgi:hypothetical protein